MEARAWIGGSIVSMRDNGDGVKELVVVHIDHNDDVTIDELPEPIDTVAH